MKTATEIEDSIFDHFGIVETQFDAANNCFKTDPIFQTLKIKVQEEIKQHMIDEYELGKDEEEKAKKLTKELATQHMQIIRSFT